MIHSKCMSVVMVAFGLALVLADAVHGAGSVVPTDRSTRTSGLPAPQQAQQAVNVTDNAKDQPTCGTFVRYKDGKLTLKGKTGTIQIDDVDGTYQAFENNDKGPGAKKVNPIATLGQLTPGLLVQVNVKDRRIVFGLDHRVIGKFAGYSDGTLKLTAPDLQPGFEDLPDERRELPVDPDVPVLQLTDADVYQYAGPAGKVLPAVKAGAVVTARSEFDPSKIEVIQVGASKRTMERYIGQSRASVRGEFVSFKNGVLRIRGKAISPLAPNEYERVMAARVDKTTSIVESTDGGEYKPSTIETLAALKEGATVTIRKAEEVVIEIQVGLPRR